MESPLPAVSVDAAQIRQVLFNLLGNSIEACADVNNPKIYIRTESVSAEGSPSAVRMTIEDNGPGFQTSVLARAFEPYITTKTTGTGLGLPMVKKILDEHKAKISIENKLEDDAIVLGARVTIVFPVAA